MKIKIFYCIVNILYVFFFVWEKINSNGPFWKGLIFLTNINYNLNIIHYSLCLIIEFNLISKRREYFNTFYNFLFSLSFTVGFMFWGMYFDNPESVLPKGVQIPIILNLYIHGGTFMICFIEQAFVYPRKTNERCNILYYLLFVTFYIAFLYIVFFCTGYPVYPFIKNKKFGGDNNLYFSFFISFNRSFNSFFIIKTP